MHAPTTWLICERTGRWAAALRVELSRTRAHNSAHQIRETRSLAELEVAIQEQVPSFVLLETWPGNVDQVLSLLAKFASSRTRFAALLEWGDETTRNCQLTTDALLEAGAVEVIDASRQLGSVVRIAERQAEFSWKRTLPENGGESIA